MERRNSALEFRWKIISSKLWRGRTGVSQLNFQVYLSLKLWLRLQIWEQIGFTVDQEQKKLFPPSMEYPEAREKLLRAWVEIAALTADFLRPSKRNFLRSTSQI